MKNQFRAVMPEVPETEVWLPYLTPSIEANWFTNFGPVNTQFEDRLFSLYGLPYEAVVTASNATAGLSTCLIAEGISGPVLCPAFTFQATAASILAAGCKPVIVDVGAISGVVTPETLEMGFRETGAAAAIVLSPYGISTDFREHAAICRKMDKLLIIDNAAGLGVSRGRWDMSKNGDVVREVFSLHATKPFGIGEGCAIFAPRTKVQSLRAAMNFGLQSHTLTGEPKQPYWGINGKMSEVHAAIGLAVADSMSGRVALRQEMAARWISYLEDVPARLFSAKPDCCPWQVMPVLLESHEHVVATMEQTAARGIELRRYYAPSLGACSGMASLGLCENAADLSARAVALPIRSTMTADEQHWLMAAVRECILEARK